MESFKKYANAQGKDYGGVIKMRVKKTVEKACILYRPPG
jgi:hypothetical protein